jgi:DNA helicase HerA-like ATPase
MGQALVRFVHRVLPLVFFSSSHRGENSTPGTLKAFQVSLVEPVAYPFELLVFDEAHRVLASDYMTSLVRECRAYGVSTILSSQYPTDFPAEISGSTATKILHSNGRDADKVRAIAQLIGCVGREAEVSGLDRFQAFIVSDQATPPSG